MSNYWPWWVGAIALALVVINYTVTTDRSFGVSSAWDRVLHWREERRIEQLEAQFADDGALAEALAAATAAHFASIPAAPGPSYAPYPAFDDSPTLSFEVPPAPPPPVEKAPMTSSRPVPLFAQAALLVSIFIGGWAAAVTSGRFQLRFDMGDGFSQIVTHNRTTMIGVLFVGGILVGFGTRLAGGCSSGHGLSGVGRLRPVSIVATAVFFGAAVVTSFLLWKVI